MYFIKHAEMRNQTPSVEMIPAQNIDEIIYVCCASVVLVNKTGSFFWLTQLNNECHMEHPHEGYLF